MKERRYALVIGSYNYEDKDIENLSAPNLDAEDLARVLEDGNIGEFEVQRLINEPYQEIREAVALFFEDRKLDDLLVLYFSGHGMMDEDGMLYYIAANTKRKILSATAISAQYVNDVMNKSRSRRQVLILDCCHSGAAVRGMVAKSDNCLNTGQLFAGEGRVVLTASDSFQYAFESNEHSIFTSILVKGLESGEADLDEDGKISIDELYYYASEKVREMTPHMSPVMWAHVKGKIEIAKNPNIQASKLPPELMQAMESPLVEVRVASIKILEKFLLSGHQGLSTASQEALMRLSKDDSQRVRDIASRMIEVHSNAKPIEIKAEEKCEICSNCKEKLSSNARFCPKCGLSMGIKCPYCGLVLRPKAKFCSGCGHAIVR